MEGLDGRDEALRLEHRFNARPERVFAAWVTPADLERWAWGSLGVHLHAAVDLRPGGRFRISTTRPDGTSWAFSGSYSEVVPNTRLAHSLTWEAPMGYESPGESILVEFSERDGGTLVVFTHTGVPNADARAEHARGWADCFKSLAKLVEVD
jgi:uncharacterized protein YndB with AHSA1/START domain